ncbi:MAG: DUF4418 family protein [Treponema sp.]|jgi:hypothetical protein|nr:DUF4418 family protein [Treponema sp.]
MKKVNIISFLLIALGVLAILGITLFFHFITYTEDGKILGNWQEKEATIYLGTAKNIVYAAGCICALGIAALLIGRGKTLKRHDVFAVLFVALGVLSIVGFLSAFYPCTMMLSNRPMRCYWTMKALIGIAGAISVSGILMLLFNQSHDRIKGLNIAVIMLSIMFLLMPTKISGVCIVHICVEKFYPFALGMGAVMLTASALNALLLKLNKKAG